MSDLTDDGAASTKARSAHFQLGVIGRLAVFLYPLDDLVADPYVWPTDELPGTLDPDQEADDDEDAECLQIAGVVGIVLEADSGEQLDDEDREEADEEGEVEEPDPLRAPGREEAQEGSDYEEQSDDGDDHCAEAGVEAGDEAEEHHGEGIGECRERGRGPDTVNVGCFRAEVRSGATEMATKRSPISAPATLAQAEKNSCAEAVVTAEEG